MWLVCHASVASSHHQWCHTCFFIGETPWNLYERTPTSMSQMFLPMKNYTPWWNLWLRQWPRLPPTVPHMFPSPWKTLPRKFTVVTLSALLKCNLLAIAKFLASSTRMVLQFFFCIFCCDIPDSLFAETKAKNIGRSAVAKHNTCHMVLANFGCGDPLGATAPWLTCLESPRQADVKL